MSDIKIQPSGSGTAVVTLTAPTTNTARTITFPDATGTLINTGSDLPAAQLTGTVADARISALTASKLTGALPAISGANLTNLDAADVSGTHTSFTSTGIDDNADATAITIDSNENVGIGNTTPGSYHSGADNLVVYASGSSGITIATGDTTSSVALKFADGTDSTSENVGYIDYAHSDNSMRFGTSASERMRIDSSGVVMVGMTSKTQTVSTQAAMYFAPTGSTNEYATLYIVHNSAQKHGIVMKDMNNGGPQLDFRNASGTQQGSIYSATSSVTYATSSDYRLKENVDYTWDATTRLKQLKPARFNWIVDDTNTLVDGFLAHEVSGIVPEAVIGEKDATEMQGIDQSKLVPLLGKTIQELEARLTAGGL